MQMMWQISMPFRLFSVPLMHDFSIEQSCQLQLAVSRCQSWLGRAATSSTSYRFRCSEHFASVFGITQGNWFQMVSLMLQLYAVVTFAFLICSTCSDICSIFSETWIWFHHFVDRSIASCALAEMPLKGKQCVEPFSTTLISYSMCINIICTFMISNIIIAFYQTAEKADQLAWYFWLLFVGMPGPCFVCVLLAINVRRRLPFRLPFFPLFSLLTGDVGRCHAVSHLFLDFAGLRLLMEMRKSKLFLFS